MSYLAYREDDAPSLLTRIHICLARDDEVQELEKFMGEDFI